jgi:WD40 repeat protein
MLRKLAYFTLLLSFLSSTGLGEVKKAATTTELGPSDLELVVQRSHARGINAIHFLPAGAGFVDISEDQTIHVRKLDGRLVRVIATGFEAWSAALSPDGQSLLVAGQSPDVIMVRLVDGQLLQTFKGNQGAVMGLAWSPDGKFVASGSAYKDIFIWRRSGERIAHLTDHKYALQSVAFSPDSSMLASADEQGYVRICSTQGQPLQSWRADEGAVSAIAFRPDSKALAVSTRKIHEYSSNPYDRGQNRVRLFGLDGTLKQSIAEREMNGLRYAADGRLVGAGAGEVTLWNTAGKVVRTYPAPGEGGAAPTSIDISHDGRLIVAASRDQPSLRLWEIEGRMRVQLLEHPAELSAAAFARDGSFAVAGWNGKVSLWSATGKLLATLNGGYEAIYGLAFSPDGSRLASAGQKLSVFTRLGVPDRTFESAAGDSATGVVFSPSGHELACGRAHGSIEVWSVDTGKLIRSFKAHAGRVEALGASPDGNLLASGSDHGQLQLWSWDGQRKATLSGHDGTAIVSAVAFSPDSSRVASVAANALLLHRRDGTKEKRLSTRHQWDNVNDVAFSPNGKELATPENQNLRLWDLASGQSRLLTGHSALVQALAYDASGQHILSASSDTSARLWNLSNGSPMILVARDTEWVSATPDGIFDASPHGGELVAMTRGLDAWAIDQFAPYNNRPDVILSRLGLGNADLIDVYRRLYLKRLRQLNLESTGGRIPASAPDVMIISAQSVGKKAKLTLRCRDAQFGLNHYDLFVNDVPVIGESRNLTGTEKQIETNLELTQGDNKIEVSCTSTRGVESLRALTYMRYDKATRGDLYFLGFGVSKYKNSALNLEFADADATELGDRFGKMGAGFDKVHVKTLTNSECTLSGMAAAKQWLDQSRVDDTVVLFVAGHGLHDSDRDETYYFLTHEADLKHLQGSAAPFELLEEMLVSAPARRKLALMDTCESGDKSQDDPAAGSTASTAKDVVSRGLRRTAGGMPRTYTYERDRFIYNSLLRRSGAIVLSSSLGGQASYESAALRHGFFTSAILKAFSDSAADRNRDSQIATDELSAYVVDTVPVLSRGLQQPTVDRDNLAQRFSFPQQQTQTMGRGATTSSKSTGPSRLDSAPAIASAPASTATDAGAAAKKACETGDIAEVKRLVPAKVSANWKGNDDWSLVMTAAYRGRTEVLRYLLSKQGNPNSELRSGYTALMQASRWGFLEATQLLLAVGADVNKGD